MVIHLGGDLSLNWKFLSCFRSVLDSSSLPVLLDFRRQSALTLTYVVTVYLYIIMIRKGKNSEGRDREG